MRLSMRLLFVGIVYSGCLFGADDTNDLRGNWFLKRKIFKEAAGKYKSGKELIASIVALSGPFDDRKKVIDAMIVDFQTNVGASLQELAVELQQLLDKIDKDRLSEEQLTEAQRITRAKITGNKQEIDASIAQIPKFQEAESALKTVLGTAHQQIDAAKAHEKDLWDFYENIADIVDDKVAAQLLLQIDSVLEHCTAIKAYLTTDLPTALDTAQASLQSTIADLSKKVQSLKDQELLFSKKIQEEEADAAKEAAARKFAKEHPEATKKAAPAPSYLNRALDTVWSWGTRLQSWWNSKSSK